MTAAPRPYGLLAELTHRCPLHCPYCSNPLQLARREEELSSETWGRVLREAAEIGVVQVGLSGGEPLLFPGLDDVVAVAREEGLYSNLITSAVGMTKERAARLRESGLDVVQVSFQADEVELADAVAGARTHEVKLAGARAVVAAGLPLGINAVLHRRTIDRVGGMIAFAEELGAMRIELANVQFLGWAFPNRAALLPSREQIVATEAVVKRETERLRGKMDVVYVLPDYHERRPKPCLHGWGQRGITINPRGEVLPCQAAPDAIPGMKFENVRERSLGEIWRESEAFQRFRGFNWMPEPCRSCEFKEVDFGGCRCQAALLTGDAGRTDPVCEFSPDRALVDAALADAGEGDFVYRG